MTNESKMISKIDRNIEIFNAKMSQYPKILTVWKGTRSKLMPRPIRINRNFLQDHSHMGHVANFRFSSRNILNVIYLVPEVCFCVEARVSTLWGGVSVHPEGECFAPWWKQDRTTWNQWKYMNLDAHCLRHRKLPKPQFSMSFYDFIRLFSMT